MHICFKPITRNTFWDFQTLFVYDLLRQFVGSWWPRSCKLSPPRCQVITDWPRAFALTSSDWATTRTAKGIAWLANVHRMHRPVWGSLQGFSTAHARVILGRGSFWNPLFSTWFLRCCTPWVLHGPGTIPGSEQASGEWRAAFSEGSRWVLGLQFPPSFGKRLWYTAGPGRLRSKFSGKVWAGSYRRFMIRFNDNSSQRSRSYRR